MEIQDNEVSSTSDVFSKKDMWEKIAALPEFRAVPVGRGMMDFFLEIEDTLKTSYTPKNNDWRIIPFIESIGDGIIDDGIMETFEFEEPDIRQMIKDYKWNLVKRNWVKSCESGSDCSVI